MSPLRSLSFLPVLALIGCQSAPDASYQLNQSPALSILAGEEEAASAREDVRRVNQRALEDPEEEPIFRETSHD